MIAVILLTVAIIVGISIYLFNKFFQTHNAFNDVTIPLGLQSFQILPGLPYDIPANVTYLPARSLSPSGRPNSRPKGQAHIPLPNDASNPLPNDERNVYIIVSGNPGCPWFYNEYMHEVHKKTNGSVHIYAIGHAYQSAQLNPRGLAAYNNTINGQNILPRINSELGFIGNGRNSNSNNTNTSPQNKTIPIISPVTHVTNNHNNNIIEPFPEHVSNLTLYQQVAQKMTFLCKIRQRHPKSKLLLTAHSMGSFCCSQVLLNLERMYVLKFYGPDVLSEWDKSQELQSTDVENDNTPINLFSFSKSVPKIVQNLPSQVTQMKFSNDELKFWMDGLLFDAVPPRHNIDSIRTMDKITKLSHITKEVTQQSHSFIIQFHGLLPTLFRIADTPNGHLMIAWFYRHKIIDMLCHAIGKAPLWIKSPLIHLCGANGYKLPFGYAAVHMIMNYWSLSNIIALSRDEMELIRSLDLNLFKRNAHKIWLYMSDVDEWAPKYQREYLQTVNTWWEKEHIQSKTTTDDDDDDNEGLSSKQEQKLQKVPKIGIHVDTEGVEHAFCFGGNEIVARHSLAYVLQAHPTFCETLI